MPNLRGDVERHVNVRVRYLDRDGVAHDEVKRGLTAGTFQHEVDHLDGMLFVDRVADPTHAHDLGAVRALPPRRVRRARSPQFVERVGSLSAGRRLLVRARPGSAATAPTPGCWSSVDGDRIVAVEVGVAAPPAGAERLAGLTLPGLANAHSPRLPPRAARRAHARRAAGRFWTWREQMYEVAARLDPDRTSRWPARRSPRWRWPGITCVGEFHYLHHAPGGDALRRPATRWARR